jgi:acyl-CoA thioester hydrolase
MATHTYQCPLRWADMDAYGVINNVVFLRLLEEARVDLLCRFKGGTNSLLQDGYVIVSHQIKYKRPLVHRQEPVAIEMWVSDLQGSSVAIEAQVKDPGCIYALASTTMAPYSYAKRFPRRLTEDEISFFEQFLENRKAIV